MATGNITGNDQWLIDDKIIHWFAQNVLIKHPKLTPIPIGLENAHYADAGYVPLYNKPLPLTKTRLPRILAWFNVHTNPKERGQAIEILSKNTLVDIMRQRDSQPKYTSTVKKYRFIVSPPGNGEDCIRTWEAMLLGTIPIVKRSTGIEYFKNLHLPFMIIDSWDGLEKLSEYDLITKYDLIMSQVDRKPLYMEYWRDLIKPRKK